MRVLAREANGERGEIERKHSETTSQAYIIYTCCRSGLRWTTRQIAGTTTNTLGTYNITQERGSRTYT